MRVLRCALLSVFILGLVTAAPALGDHGDPRAPAAVAAVSVTRVDESNGVRFHLNGRRLTLRLAPQRGSSPPDVRRDVWGKGVQAVCSATFSQRRAGRIALSARAVVWPRGARTLRLRLDRDVSSQVRWCLLEVDGGSDVASVTFRAFIWVGGDDKADRRIGQELRRYLLAKSGPRPWLSRIDAIYVDDRRIAVATELTPDAAGQADRPAHLRPDSSLRRGGSTTGHRVLGVRGNVLRTCSA